MIKPFKKNDVFVSTIKTYPEIKFFIYDRKIYYNNKIQMGSNIDTGTISLYEENINRASGQLIYPFITKEGSLTSFKTMTTSQFNSDFGYGDTITSSYPLTASIRSDRYALNATRADVVSLQNVLNRNKIFSKHYSYTDKATQELRMISIPSIFYGSNIKKGSVDIKFYISGSLVGRLQDIRRNGELIQTLPQGTYSGSVAGVTLYNEGFVLLTGSWNITNEHTEVYVPGAAASSPRWIDMCSTGSSGAGENLPSSSFDFQFQGTQYVNVMTLNCHLGKGEYNFSNNPTFLSYGQNFNATTSSYEYVENDSLTVKNIVKTNWVEPTGSFEKITYCDKVIVYDEYKNIIAIAKLATPLKKNENQIHTVRVKIDL